MKHLQNISITNARSFGDIKIDIGPGATIILAPNGIGKTTIYEAIEFALTGSIQRLTNSLFAFVRKGQTEANVRLEFDDKKYCAVKYCKDDKTPKIYGDHKILFNSQDKNVIPYLLRLTHLLEQRGTHWFVQASEEDAGNLLDKLSIGKDLNLINRKMKSVKQRANELKDNAAKELTEAQNNLNAFKELRKKRKDVTINFVLRPLKEILAQLDNVFKLAGGSTKETTNTLSEIIGYSGQIKGKIDNQIEEFKARAVLLAKFDSLLPEYDSKNNILRLKKESHEKLLKEKLELENELNDQKILLQKNSEQIEEIELKIKELKEKKILFESVDNEKARKLEIEKELTEKQKALLKLQEQFKQKTEALKKANSIRDIHNLFSKQTDELSRLDGKISTLREFINNWKKHNDTIAELENTAIPNLNRSIKIKEKELSDIRVEHINNEQAYNEALNKFKSLRDASDAIHNAVSIIASNLPKERGDCPVCGQVYSPGELKSRISEAIDAIDPMMTLAVANKKEATEKYDISKSKLAELQISLDHINEKLVNANNKCLELRSIINEQIRPQFPQCETIQDAIEWISKQQKELELKQQKLNENINDAPDEPTSEQFHNLEINKVNIEREISDTNSRIQSIQLVLKEIDEKLKITGQKINGQNFEFIKKEIENREANLSLLQDKFKKEAIQIDKKQKRVNEVTVQIDEISKYILKIDTRQSEIKTEWINTKLNNEPSVEELAKEKKEIIQKLEVLNRNKTVLNEVAEDLARWQTAELYQKYDNEIKIICDTKTEEEYLNKLESDSKNCKRRLQIIIEKSGILESLHTNINNQLKSVHEYIESVNPFWQNLLKRVVLDMWFSETPLLRSYSSYNKPKAEARISVNEKKVHVDKIASETQITDLQLTFMLAMTKTYTWTSWRCLLLDDPTQHHDLVHAAAVFDLLRDYIADYDYQILLATHDTVQARFFLRKLQNDGLPARIWKLIPSDTGVIAKKSE